MAISQAVLGRVDVARAQFDRVRRNDMITDGATDEVVAFAAVLGDAALARTYVERAVEHVRKVSAPEKADNSERAVRALEALAARRYQEAYNLAVSAGNDPGEHSGVFVAGISALRLKRWDDATKAFNTMLEHPAKLGLSPLIPIVHVMLGRAHTGAGRTAEARKSVRGGLQDLEGRRRGPAAACRRAQGGTNRCARCAGCVRCDGCTGAQVRRRSALRRP